MDPAHLATTSSGGVWDPQPASPCACSLVPLACVVVNLTVESWRLQDRGLSAYLRGMDCYIGDIFNSCSVQDVPAKAVLRRQDD